MILFNSRNARYKSPSKELKAEFKKHSDAVKKALPATCPDKLELGCKLIELWNSSSYSVLAEEACATFSNALKTNCHSKVFFFVCEKEFGLDKSQVSRYMNVVDEFCLGSDLLLQYKEFSYSQLVELLSLNEDQRKEVKPDWSVSRIRAYKKSLRPVAMSQQKADDFEEPDEYKGLSRRQLIEYLISCSEERSVLLKELEKHNIKNPLLEEVEDGERDITA